MSDMISSSTESSDAELISAVRAGDSEAYGTLFGRHRDAAMRLSRQLVRGADADDLMAESFTRVLVVLQAGKGPNESFRAYLLSSIRRLHIDKIRASKRVRTTGDESELDRAVEFVDPAEMKFEQGAAAAAFASLPERWQLVLWHLDVEGQKPAEIAPLLGMSANSVSALAYRAREGLRQAYLQGHLAPPLDDNCRWTTGQLGSYVRKGLSARDTAKVDAHLDECSRCTALYLELAEVNSNLAGLLAPALLGTAAAGYLASTGSTAVAGGFFGHLLDKATRPVRTAAKTVPPTIVALVTIAAVAVAGTIVVSQVWPDDKPVTATQPTATAPSPTPDQSLANEPDPDPEIEVSPSPDPQDTSLTPDPALVIPPPATPKDKDKPKPREETRPKPEPKPEPAPGTHFSLGHAVYHGIADPPVIDVDGHVHHLDGPQAWLTVNLSALADPTPNLVSVTVHMVSPGESYVDSVDSAGWTCDVPEAPLSYPAIPPGAELVCSAKLMSGTPWSLMLATSPFTDDPVEVSLTVDGHDAGPIPSVPMTPDPDTAPVVVHRAVATIRHAPAPIPQPVTASTVPPAATPEPSVEPDLVVTQEPSPPPVDVPEEEPATPPEPASPSDTTPPVSVPASTAPPAEPDTPEPLPAS